MCSSQCSVNYEAFSLGGSRHSPSPVWAPGTISLILLVASFPGLRASSQACDDLYSVKYSRGPSAVLQRVLCTPLLTLVLSLVKFQLPASSTAYSMLFPQQRNWPGGIYLPLPQPGNSQNLWMVIVGLTSFILFTVHCLISNILKNIIICVSSYFRRRLNVITYTPILVRGNDRLTFLLLIQGLLVWDKDLGPKV